MASDNFGTIARQLVSDAIGIDQDKCSIQDGIETLDQWDSLRHVNVVMTIENYLGRTLDVEEIIRAVKVKEIALILESNQTC